LMRKQEKLKNKDSMKLTNNHLDENNFWHFPKMKRWRDNPLQQRIQRCYDEKFTMLCKNEHEDNGNHNMKMMMLHVRWQNLVKVH
jgi:hypothetical protein